MARRKTEFAPGHHAVLFGLLGARCAEALGEEAAEEVLAALAERYGLQRGDRMRRRAVRDGCVLGMLAYRAYGEWEADPDSVRTETVALGPDNTVRHHSCPWHDAWKENDMLPYGAVYCRVIDRALVRGFSQDLVLEIPHQLTDGESDYCEFVWHGLNLNEENQRRLDALRAHARAYVKDWPYHIGHLWWVAEQILEEMAPEKAEEILDSARKDFAARYGPEAELLLEKAAQTDYSDIFD